MAATETTSFLKLRRRAEQGHDMAQYSLGVSYEIGEGVSQDNIEAVKWYQLSPPSRGMSMPNTTSGTYTPQAIAYPKT